MTRRADWLLLTASALAAGLTPQAARLAADETLAECDERFPPDGEMRVVNWSEPVVTTAEGPGKR